MITIPSRVPPMLMAATEKVIDSSIHEDFAEACRRRIGEILAGDAWTVGDTVLSSSQEWGIIYRLSLTHMNPEFAVGQSHVVCWTKDGKTISTSVALWQ